MNLTYNSYLVKGSPMFTGCLTHKIICFIKTEFILSKFYQSKKLAVKE
jgi:hypothetical protein